MTASWIERLRVGEARGSRRRPPRRARRLLALQVPWGLADQPAHAPEAVLVVCVRLRLRAAAVAHLPDLRCTGEAGRGQEEEEEVRVGLDIDGVVADFQSA